MQKIKIGNKLYPAYQTMGAMVAFKNETNKDVTALGDGDLSTLLTYLFFVVRSACRREQEEFPFSGLEEFADGISLEDFTAWSEEAFKVVTPAAPVEPDGNKTEGGDENAPDNAEEGDKPQKKAKK